MSLSETVDAVGDLVVDLVLDDAARTSSRTCSSVRPCFFDLPLVLLLARRVALAALAEVLRLDRRELLVDVGVGDRQAQLVRLPGRTRQRWTRNCIACLRSAVYCVGPCVRELLLVAPGSSSSPGRAAGRTASFEIVQSPTTATSFAPTALLATPAAGSDRERRRRATAKRATITGLSHEKSAICSEFRSRCLARFEYSIDQLQGFRKLLVLNRNFISGRSVDRGVDAIAQRPQLL